MSTSTTSASAAGSKSTQTFITALILNSAIAGGEILAWLLIRRYFPRIFQPRADLPPEGRRTKALPRGLIGVIPAILLADDEDIISANGLDAYMFVRFLKLMFYLFLGIAGLTWIILLPVYGTSTAGNEGLNRFTFGNVGLNQQNRLVAPLLICWFTTFFILYMIRVEYGRFIEKRQDFLTSRAWSTKAQSRTVLLTGIPEDYCNLEALESLTKTMPGGVRKIWLARDVKGLDKIYDRRTKAVKKLESADNKIIKLANKLVRKKKVPEEGNTDQEKNGLLSSRYIPDNKRPSMRLGKVPLIGKKVDTIDWATEEIETTNKKLSEKRSDVGNFKPKSSAFILFNDQIAAHIFAQALAHQLPLAMSSRYINVSPDDVIWSTLSVNPYSKRMRVIASLAATVAIIVFWSPLTAFVTSISNVSSLCKTVGWLSWLCKLPVPINGLIQGILPPVALMLLFMLLPPFLRFLSVSEGTPLRSLVEHSLQKRYFAFLFVQGFIIATLASGIMAGISQITKNPSSAVSLLANNLPKSSVFFLTLIVTNGLSGAAGGVLQITKLIIYYVKVILLGGSPRALHKIRYTMPSVKFGQIFPAQLLLVVIALAYSTIAPLVCGFAVLTFGLWWFAYKYLFLWVYDQPAAGETGGLFFKTAIMQLFAGLYIQHLCLIGLFFLARDERNKISALPEAILMIVLLVLTILFQLLLQSGYSPLVEYLPLSMANSMNRNEDRYAHEMAEEKRRVQPMKTRSQRMNGTKNENSPLTNTESRTEDPDRSNSELIAAEEHDRVSDEEGFDELEGGLGEHTFHHPALYRGQPTIWLAKDKLGLSGEAVRNARARGIDITDQDANINDKGKVEIYRDTVPGLDLAK